MTGKYSVLTVKHQKQLNKRIKTGKTSVYLLITKPEYENYYKAGNVQTESE